MGGKIFVSYRRDDDPSAAARVRDGLVARFGKNSVFMDVDNLLAGQRFDEELAKALSVSDVLVAVMGTRWVGLLESRAQSSERDYVREEIAGALKRRIVVVPVRVGRDGQLAPLPRAEALPEDIRELVLYQKHDVTHENFSRDIAELGNAIAIVRRGKQAPRPWGKVATGIAAALILGGGVWAVPKLMGNPSDDPPLVTASTVDTATSSTNAPAQTPAFEPSVPEPAKTEVAVAAPPAQTPDTVSSAAKPANLEVAIVVPPVLEAPATCNFHLVKVGSKVKCLKPGDAFRDCDVCPEMVVIPSGAFTMGSPDYEAGRDKDEGPQHDVTFAKPFAVGKFEVTRGEYRAFVEATGRSDGETCVTLATGGPNNGRFFDFVKGRSWRDAGYEQTDQHPVTCVSWDDAKAYAEWLSRRTGHSYRLPSEAEWEYAARGRTSPDPNPPYHFGGDADELCSYGNVADRTKLDWQRAWVREKGGSEPEAAIAQCDDGAFTTTAVGSYSANAFGIHDIHGNLREWVEDCYKASYEGVPQDGSSVSMTDCANHVNRGGSAIDDIRKLRAAFRGNFGLTLLGEVKASELYAAVGIRVSRDLIR